MWLLHSNVKAKLNRQYKGQNCITTFYNDKFVKLIKNNSKERNTWKICGSAFCSFRCLLCLRNSWEIYVIREYIRILINNFLIIAIPSDWPSKDWENHILKMSFIRVRDLKLIGSFLNQSAERERQCTRSACPDL